MSSRGAGRVDYDRIASLYDRRFASQPSDAIGAALADLARSIQARRVVEAGCGTGRWLAGLRSDTCEVVGLDSSHGMLREAHGKQSSTALVQGGANELPFQDDSFDLVFCVNAVHHFGRPLRFIEEAARLLRPDGALAVLGSGPPENKDNWYAYL
ncbi:MAG: class I SAM-dependent methyltransferase [SAR202 cluster bacterium]|nr:class I SAM-dependent methyltransferase [SAR202 cluster bacterium]MDP6664480.1 class I SAM-dependent methyltransferase [SAR202 cluster bacterium]MDP6801507.1 class I SAM-dependent methyltransferase [SAR202 cluster bacterium]